MFEYKGNFFGINTKEEACPMQDKLEESNKKSNFAAVMLINAKEITVPVQPNQKVNYDSVLKEMMKSWEAEATRPRLLIHSCCAPCSTYVLERLSRQADITIYFANPNIHPKEEYLYRSKVQKQFIEDFNRQTDSQVQFLEEEYCPQEFFQRTMAEKDAPEGGRRCAICYQMRLDKAARKAQELGFDYFASALTLSPMKNSQKINELGLEIQEVFAVKYLPSDFKKNNGYKRSIELCKEYDVYRQCYCGCIFAAIQQGVDLQQVIDNARENL